MSMKYFKIFMALEPFSATHFNGYLGIWDNRTEEIFKRISFFKVLRFWLYLHFCFSITFLRFLISQFGILTCTCVYSMFTGMCKYNFFVLRCASSPCGTLRRKKKKIRTEWETKSTEHPSEKLSLYTWRGMDLFFF